MVKQPSPTPILIARSRAIPSEFSRAVRRGESCLRTRRRRCRAGALTGFASIGQPRANRLAVALSTATLSRIPRLLSEIPIRRPAEEQLIVLKPDRLPWQAQYALALTVIDIARRRADESLLAKELTRAGCVSTVAYVGIAGRLPYLDLDAEGPLFEIQPRGLVATGCQFQLNAADGQAAVRILRSEVELKQGRYDIVLDYGGPARLRVDGGHWHRHGGRSTCTARAGRRSG